MHDSTPLPAGKEPAFLADIAQPALLIRGNLVLAMTPEAGFLFGYRKATEFDPAPLGSLLGESIADRIIRADKQIPTSFPITIERAGRIRQSAMATKVSFPDPECSVLLITVKHRSMLDIISNEYRSLIDTLPDLVIVHDELGTILFANTVASQVLDISIANLVGTNVLDLLPREELIAARQRGKDRLKTGADKFFGYQLRRQTAEGEAIDLDIRSMPFWKDGVRDLVLVVGKNATPDESRQIHLETARLRAEADSASKSAVLAQTSHEIRTPLNIVFGMIDMALDQTISPTASGYLTMARSAARTLLSLLDDFLEFSKLEAGKLTLRESFFSPEEVIREACAGLELLAKEKDLHLRLVIDAKLPPRLFGDAGRLRQIIANLTTNAIKYTESGTIRVKVGLASRDNDRCNLHLRIADTGCGISPQALPFLFQPFYQINQETEGSGLGLAIVKELVELLGGRVWVESVEGRGSEFHFTAEFRFDAATTSPETGHPLAPALDDSP